MRKHLLLLLYSISMATLIIAQPPQAFKYQAIVRDAAGNIISNQAVNARISIINNDAGGPLVYQETHLTTTNEFGIITLLIGEGTPVASYNFEDINWGELLKFIEVEIDPTGGSNYISMGISELVSVPYALFSESSADGYGEKSNEDISYNNGNVGIGSLNPTNKFEVGGAALIGTMSKGIRLRTDGLFTDIESLGTNLAINYFGIGNTYMNVVSGNVGIGTSNPYHKLDVNGDSDIAINAISTDTYAIWGKTEGSGTAGVIGEGSSIGNWGVYGYNPNGGIGVRGLSNGGWAGYFHGNMYVSGNTGIGTTTPDNKLVIKSSGAGDVFKILSNTDNTLAKIRHTGNNSGALYLYDGLNNSTVI